MFGRKKVDDTIGVTVTYINGKTQAIAKVSNIDVYDGQVVISEYLGENSISEWFIKVENIKYMNIQSPLLKNGGKAPRGVLGG